MSRIIVCLLLGWVSPQIMFAQPKPPAVPNILYAIPLGVPLGKKSTVILRGTGLDKLTQVETPGTKIPIKLRHPGKPATIPNNYPANKLGNSEVEIELDLTGQTTPNLTLRLRSDAGLSAPFSLIARRDPDLEQEPNDSFAQAQTIKPGQPFWGKIGREKDVDVTQFSATKGQAVVIEVNAARAGSPLDPILTLLDDQKKIIAIVDDTDGTRDPKFRFVPPQTGKFYLVLQDAHDLGGAMFGYELKISVPE